MNLFDNQQNTINVDLPDAEVVLYESFFSTSQSNELFVQLKNKIEWRQDSMKMYGKDVNLPRLTAWHGDNDKNYSFSGITLNPQIWTSDLLLIKQRIETVVNTNFNSVLLNFYRNGNDSISWHTDDETELGKNPTIASVTFGETRQFQLKHRYKKELKTITIPLQNGSLLLMKGTTQHFWLHQIPKSTKQLKERINLTFRTIK